MSAAAAAGTLASFVEVPYGAGAGAPAAAANRVRLSNRLAHFFELPYNSEMHVEQIQGVVEAYIRTTHAVGDDGVVWHHSAIWALLRIPDTTENVRLTDIFRDLRTQHLTSTAAAAESPTS